jgi:hypothetical protein
LVNTVKDIFSGTIVLASHWLEDCAKFYANAGGKLPIQRQPLLVQYKQQRQANPLLSMHITVPIHHLRLVGITKKAANIIKPTKTRICRKKYANGSVN